MTGYDPGSATDVENDPPIASGGEGAAPIEGGDDGDAPIESSDDGDAPVASGDDGDAPIESSDGGGASAASGDAETVRIATDGGRDAEFASFPPEHGTVAYDLDTYESLLQWLRRQGYEFVGFDGEIGDGEIALRHDVDLSVERAVEMAKLEAASDVAATYCVLVTSPVYDVLEPETRRRIRCIVDAGHDVALHFDPHNYWEDEPLLAEVEARVGADRRALERALDVSVDAVSFHVPPEWALGVDFERFDSTYAPRYFSEVAYVSDSSQKWRTAPPFEGGLPDAAQLLVHPGLWTPEDRPVDDVVASVRDRRVNELDAYLAPIGE